MRINWRIKSFIFRIIDIFDLQSILYVLQRYATGRSKNNILQVEDSWLLHESCVSKYQSPWIIEFGAGKSLSQNIYLSRTGAIQWCVDVNPMLDMELFNDAVEQVASLVPEIQCRSCSSLNEIERFYNIKYVSPFSFDGKNLEKNSIDIVISTNTMEHIPENQLIELLTHVFDALKPGGSFSARIDYSDHYASTDGISQLNFLKFSELEWQKFNHNCHFQNRLRHSSYRRLIEAAGFIIVKDRTFERCELPLEIASCFDLSDPSIDAINGYFLAVKPGPLD